MSGFARGMRPVRYPQPLREARICWFCTISEEGISMKTDTHSCAVRTDLNTALPLTYTDANGPCRISSTVNHTLPPST